MPGVDRAAALRPAVHVVRLAPLDLYLDRRVGDSETARHHVHDRSQDLLALADRLFGHHDVTNAGHGIGADAPDMNGVHVPDAGQTLHRLADRDHVRADGGAFEWHRDAVRPRAAAAPE